MKSLAIALALAIACTLTFTFAAWAGGEALDDHPQDEGPYYFGFVKDTARKAIRDAKVTAEIKGRPTIVARTNAAGFYRIPGFGKDIAPSSVTAFFAPFRPGISLHSGRLFRSIPATHFGAFRPPRIGVKSMS